ncbi:MAG: DUF6629 family protein [Gemmatimonadaceae bacterium]
MCFSATASFTAGAALIALGATTLTKAARRSEAAFATIPLLFGTQQTIEGVIWLTFSHHAPGLQHVMIYVYSIFSHVLWPIYVPFAFRQMEPAPGRRRAMLWFQGAGVAVGGYLLYFLIKGPLGADVIGHHIVYQSPKFYLPPVMVLYLASTCFTGFLSSHVFVRVFGVLSLTSAIATYVVFTAAMVSVWCFFAAILSVFIDFHLRRRGMADPHPRIDARAVDAIAASLS